MVRGIANHEHAVFLPGLADGLTRVSGALLMRSADHPLLVNSVGNLEQGRGIAIPLHPLGMLEIEPEFRRSLLTPDPEMSQPQGSFFVCGISRKCEPKSAEGFLTPDQPEKATNPPSSTQSPDSSFVFRG